MDPFTSMLWFVVVLAAIPLVLWLLKRSALVGGATGSAAGTPKTVAVLALSPSQRVVTVELGQGEERVWVVLGVTPQSIRTLHTLGAPAPGAEAAAATPGPSATFSQLLGRLRQGAGGGTK